MESSASISFHRHPVTYLDVFLKVAEQSQKSARSSCVTFGEIKYENQNHSGPFD